MTKFAPILGALLLLAGCDYDLPKVDSGYMYRISSGGTPVKQELTFLQVAAFSEWCAAHRTGWTHEISDVAPETLITFRREGVDIIAMSLQGTRLSVGSRSLPLTVEDANALQAILKSGEGWQAPEQTSRLHRATRRTDPVPERERSASGQNRDR